MKWCAIAVIILLVGCQTSAGQRIGQDAFVVFTSPIQIPAMSARDAIRNFPEIGTSATLFPVTFPLYLFEHTALSLAHLGDLLIFPAHFFSERDSLRIYRGIGLPLERGPNAKLFSEGVGATLLIAVGIGLPILWYAFSSSQF